MNAIKSLSEARSKQIEENSNVYGIACLKASVGDMREEEVFETYASKVH